MSDHSTAYSFEPIGYFNSGAKYSYDAPRQATLSKIQGKIVLNQNCNYEQALKDLSGFSHVWVIYVFDRNSNWKPLITPPRGNHKVGVFASRAPYRPNPIGMSCVELLGVGKRDIILGGSDLLDATPILDIKPYLGYCDAIENTKHGWIDEIPDAFSIYYSDISTKQLKWLERNGVINLESFITTQLTDNPEKTSKKRIYQDGKFSVLAYRTWRAYFNVNFDLRKVFVEKIGSGYSEEEMADGVDKYLDKGTHREFLAGFGDREINNEMHERHESGKRKINL